MNFDNLPRNFSPERLRREELLLDPKKQFLLWLQEAQDAKINEFNAMTLATASQQGKPSCRIVLLKHADDKGLLFFTNYNSRKSKEIHENPNAMVTFFWGEVMRQIGIEGVVEKTTREESWEYFLKRPRGSRLGAWASPQDQVIPFFNLLEKNFSELDEKYKEKEIPLPPFWGGFRLIPNRYEFWQGGQNRLHDRFQYVLEGNIWKIERLAP